ncbi:MAG: 1-acyl-sn-glycerol-3-phosphate acyltransferase [Salinivenus sp.]
MKPFLYHLLKHLVRITSWFAFRRVEVRGMDRVPWEKPCIVSPNHQNAFLDALLVGAFAPVKLTYLSRASVFGTRLDWFLDALRMVPIYRRRDGFGKLSRNEQIFAALREKLRRGESMVMFSETEHALTYHLRPISRGSSRFALESQAAIDREVMVVPVGINYYHHTRLGFKVSLVVGEPLPAREYIDQYRDHEARGINALREDLTDAMKACLLVPDKTDDYRERVDRINRKNEGLSFPEMKRALRTPETLAAKGEHRPGLETLAQGISVLNAGPLWLTSTLMRWVDEPAFAASLKFAVGMLVLPVWWLGLFGVGTWAAGPTVGAGVTGLAVLTIGLRLVLIRHSNPPHSLD